MNFIFYGLLFIGVGIWNVVRERKARSVAHVHVCPKCGTSWQHRRDDYAEKDWQNTREWLDAHTCSKCGEEVFKIAGYAPDKKTPLNVAGRAQTSTGGNVASRNGLTASGAEIGKESPAPSPKDRDTADHGAGPALPTEPKAS